MTARRPRPAPRPMTLGSAGGGKVNGVLYGCLVVSSGPILRYTYPIRNVFNDCKVFPFHRQPAGLHDQDRNGGDAPRGPACKVAPCMPTKILHRNRTSSYKSTGISDEILDRNQSSA